MSKTDIKFEDSPKVMLIFDCADGILLVKALSIMDNFLFDLKSDFLASSPNTLPVSISLVSAL